MPGFLPSPGGQRHTWPSAPPSPGQASWLGDRQCHVGESEEARRGSRAHGGQPVGGGLAERGPWSSRQMRGRNQTWGRGDMFRWRRSKRKGPPRGEPGGPRPQTPAVLARPTERGPPGSPGQAREARTPCQEDECAAGHAQPLGRGFVPACWSATRLPRGKEWPAVSTVQVLQPCSFGVQDSGGKGGDAGADASVFESPSCALTAV